MYKYLISIQYDGTIYNGWAKQKNKKIVTIHEVLDKAIGLVLKNSKFQTFGASRTDKGVHALDQKVLLLVEFKLTSLNSFKNTINKILPNDIYINSIFLKDNSFFISNYKLKEYHYNINLNDSYDVFLQRNNFHLNKKDINIKKFKKIFSIFVGYHNFDNFCGLLDGEKIDRNRNIENIIIKKNNNNIKIIFIGHSFIRYQLRYIVGSAIAYSQEKITKKKLIDMLKNGGIKKMKIMYKAKSNGLTLQKILF